MTNVIPVAGRNGQPNVRSLPASAEAEVDAALIQAFEDLAARQQPLGEPFTSILRDNLWDLYIVAEPQGGCETTLTERFRCNECSCGTYEGNLGPCRTFLTGKDHPERCVYCDHAVRCHELVTS